MYSINHIGYLEKDHELAIQLWKKNGYKIKFSKKVDRNQNIICSLFFKRNFPNIEIISEYKENKQSTIKNRLCKGIHIDHICYNSLNIEKTIKKLQKDNFKLVYKAMSPVFKKKIAFLFSANECLIEIMQK